MAPGAGFESNMHRPHFQPHRFTRAKILFDQRQILDLGFGLLFQTRVFCL